METIRLPRVVRFGVFEADRRSRELRKHGLRIKLHEQPFRVLELLLERPGELITREEFQRHIWPANTLVDFEQGLNVAMKRLRQALGDSADVPRFVETLPRRGYRFIAPVEAVPISGLPDRPPAGDETENGAHRAYEALASASPSQSATTWTRHRVVTWGVAAAVSLLAALALQAVVRRGHPTASPAPPVRALAVLPLENLSGDPGQEYFADGMTEALIINLAHIRSLTVIAPSSVMGYKATQKPLREIARELNVDAIVEGAFSRAGEQVRIDVRLIDPGTGRHLWTASYERKVGEVTSLQSDIARGVANEIRATLTPEEQARLQHMASVDPDTYELYIKGRYFQGKLSPAKSIEYFQAAINRRPDYALAYASMAEAYSMSGLEPQEARAKIKTAALAALRIDDTVAEAHVALAQAYFRYDWDWTSAQREFERALDLNPNDAIAHQWYGQYQNALGWKNWAAEVKRAAELDPLMVWLAGGGWYLQSGEYDKAIELMKKKLEIDPNNANANQQMGRVYTMKGMCEEATRYLEKAVAIPGGWPGRGLGPLGYAYAKCGRRADAMKVLAQLEQLSRRRYVYPHLFAVVYAGLGEKDAAFKWLDEAVVKRDPNMVMLNVSLELESLRSDPRFAELKRRVGLPQ